LMPPLSHGSRDANRNANVESPPAQFARAIHQPMGEPPVADKANPMRYLGSGTPPRPGWRNWQTQQTQNLPALVVMGVRPPLPAPNLSNQWFRGRSKSRSSNSTNYHEGGTMRPLFRNFVPLLLASILSVPVLVTGCQSQAPPQAAPQNDSYIQWEHDTHREHVDINKRSAEERKQYEDWRGGHH
jgi:hypothetical protein